MFFKIAQKSLYTWTTFETKYFTQLLKIVQSGHNGAATYWERMYVSRGTCIHKSKEKQNLKPFSDLFSLF